MINIWTIPVAAVMGILFVIYLAFRIMAEPAGDAKMKAISNAIKEGSKAYLKREYQILAIYLVIMAAALFFFISKQTCAAFVFGAVLSAVAGYVGISMAAAANTRTANAARKSLKDALAIAFSSGAVMGLIVVSFGLLGLFILFKTFAEPALLIGFGLGASSIALFARVGGGIFTKSADIGADMVGLVEKNMPEDDARNPATIADNVGDNVGDVAGMGADLYESYVGAIIAAMILGALFIGAEAVIYPLMIGAAGIISSLIGMQFVKVKNENLNYVLQKGLWISTLLVAIASLFISKNLFNSLAIFYATLAGLLAGILIGLSTEFYTSIKTRAVRIISQSAKTGAATNILQGLSVGMFSTFPQIIFLIIAVLMAYYFAGFYGIAVAAVGMLSTLGISLAIDAYGPVADNAGGIAEMSGLPREARERTNSLDALGNTTAAIGKGFAIGSAALTSLALFLTFSHIAGNGTVLTLNLLNPLVLIGILLGGMLPFIFASMSLRAVASNAFLIIKEARKQFKIRGVLEGRVRPDYSKIVDIATKGALRQMLLPGIIAVFSPLAVGFVFGLNALGGMLAGSILTGVLLAITFANSGGAWDNAKRYIESGKFGGRGSEAHKAAIIGDTIGDPFKDTVAPSLSILIKMMTIVAIVFIPVFLVVGSLFR